MHPIFSLFLLLINSQIRFSQGGNDSKLRVLIEERTMRMMIDSGGTLKNLSFLLEPKPLPSYPSLSRSVRSEKFKSEAIKRDDYSWKNGFNLNVSREYIYCFAASADSKDNFLCMNYKNSTWYGGPWFEGVKWPFNKNKISMEPNVVDSTRFGSTSESYWVNSDGEILYVYHETPIYVDSNDRIQNQLCMTTKKGQSPYTYQTNYLFKYELCVFGSPVIAHKFATQIILKKPSALPDMSMVEYPVMTTNPWKNPTKLTEADVSNYHRQLTSNKMKVSSLLIDAKWEKCFGALQFDTTKFPKHNATINALHSKNIKIGLTTYPYIAENCRDFKTSKEAKRFVEGKNNKILVHSKGVNYDSTYAAYDITKNEVADWWILRLEKSFKELKHDFFYLYNGHLNYLPQPPKLHEVKNPNEYVEKLMETFGKLNRGCIVQTGRISQSVPCFVKIRPKESNWSAKNGLRAQVIELLHKNLNGYGLVMSEHIGGGKTETKPNDELYIRWLQASLFMPSVLISYPPWSFKNKTRDIVMKMLDIRHQHFPLIKTAIHNAVESGEPVNPPIWWIAPTDPIALNKDDEYLLGDSVLVAPVLDPGKEEREVYLPEGNWIDLKDQKFKGPRSITYKATLDVLPFFIKIK